MGAPRILLCGDVLGRFNLLFKRISAVNRSSGPFDALLCVGQFFPTHASEIGEMMEYLEGGKEICIPTYFIGDYGDTAAMALSSAKSKARALGLTMEGISICGNLYWLKGSGIFDLQGLRVAYLAGKYDASVYKDAAGASSVGAYHEDDVDALRALADDPGVVDIFLTNEWPQGVLNGADIVAASTDFKALSSGSALVADLAAELKPRYHVAGCEGVYYTREPYTNKDVLHVTRFVGLATVGNEKKQKFLHALSPTPASAMASSELGLRPPNTTSSPYTTSKAKDSRAGHRSLPSHDTLQGLKYSQISEGQYWRFEKPQSKRQKSGDGGMGKVCFEFLSKGSCSRGQNCNFKHDAGKQDGGGAIPAGVCFDFFRKGKCERGAECRFGHDLDKPRGPTIAPPEQCWFCLASPDVDAHLVVSVGDYCYCAMAKGGLVQDHVLILPIEHFPSTISLPTEAAKEMQKFKEAFQQFFKSQGSSTLTFERFMQLKAGTHAHLQVVPVPLLKASAAKGAFLTAAKELGFGFDVIRPNNDHTDTIQALKNLLDRGANYFFVELPEGTVLAHPLEPGEKMPMQLGREVAAKLLGMPDRSDWRQCKLSQEEEVANAERFREVFQKFDPFK